MDLSTFDYVATLDRGRRIELRHPGTGKPFSEHGGQALFVHILGVDSTPVEEVRRANQRELLRFIQEKQDPPASLEIEVACAAVVGFEGGTGAVSTLEDFRQFLRTHPDGKHIARQIIREAENLGRFFTGPPSD